MQALSLGKEKPQQVQFIMDPHYHRPLTFFFCHVDTADAVFFLLHHVEYHFERLHLVEWLLIR